MSTVMVSANDVKVSQSVREAVERRDAVTVVVHKRSRFVVIHPDDYEFVRAMLERRRRGQSVPIEELLTDDDLAVLAMNDDGDAAGWELLASVE